jgi:hypothetical protein
MDLVRSFTPRVALPWLVLTSTVLAGCQVDRGPGAGPAGARLQPRGSSAAAAPPRTATAEGISVSGGLSGQITVGTPGVCGAANGIEVVALSGIRLAGGKAGSIRIVVNPYSGASRYVVGSPAPALLKPGLEPASVVFRPTAASGPTFTSTGGVVTVDPGATTGALQVDLRDSVSGRTTHLAGPWRCGQPAPALPSPRPGMIPWSPAPQP